MKYCTFLLLLLFSSNTMNANTNRLDGALPEDSSVEEEFKYLLNRGYVELNVSHRFHHGSASSSGCYFFERSTPDVTHAVKIPLRRLGKNHIMGTIEIESSDPNVNYFIRVVGWEAPSGLYLDYNAHIRYGKSTLGSINGASGKGVIYKNRAFQKVGQNYVIRLIPERKCLLAEFAVSDHTTPIQLPKSFNKRIQ